jgi:putative transposase
MKEKRMKLTYKYKVKASKKTKENIEECLMLCRHLYNACIDHRVKMYDRVKHLKGSDNWKEVQKTLPSYYSQKKELPEIKKFDERYSKYPSNIFQEVTDRVNKTYSNFFRGAGYPQFKSRRFYSSFTLSYANGYFMDGFGSTKLMSKQLNENYNPIKPFLKISNMGILKILGYKKYKIQGIIKTITIEKKDDSVWVCFSTDNAPEYHDYFTGNSIGIDVGIANYLTMSDGTKIENPDFGKKFEKRERVLNRSLARKKLHSSRWKEVKKQIAREKSKLSRQRKLFQHELSKIIVQKYDTIVMENLSLKNMTKSAKGTIEEPGKNVAQKSGLNRVLLDGAFYQFRMMIEYKCKKYGKQLIVVDPKFTSQTCNKCGHKHSDNRVSQELFLCKLCGHSDHADVNAAKNILDKGLEKNNYVKTG